MAGTAQECGSFAVPVAAGFVYSCTGTRPATGRACRFRNPRAAVEEDLALPGVHAAPAPVEAAAVEHDARRGEMRQGLGGDRGGAGIGESLVQQQAQRCGDGVAGLGLAGRTPSRIYCYGLSEGGREGLLVAQRYPEL